MGVQSKEKIELTDDSKEKVRLLVWHRLPWLFLGLAGSAMATFFVSRFEDTLREHISLVFFMPLVVYIADAAGTQTQTIFVRNLASGRDKFAKYILKEILLGIGLGTILGVVVGGAAFAWLREARTALVVGMAIFVNLVLAPLVALLVSEILYRRKTDPALGSGPVTTIVQDVLSIFVYFMVSLAVFLH